MLRPYYIRLVGTFWLTAYIISRRYFGEKVGIYFTWIGFYTSWLLPVSLLGIVIFLYGLSTIPSSSNAVAYDTCETRRDYFYMCPVCDEKCDFWYLGDTCNFAHVSFSMESERGIVELHIPMCTQLYMYIPLPVYMYVQCSFVFCLSCTALKMLSSWWITCMRPHCKSYVVVNQ